VNLLYASPVVYATGLTFLAEIFSKTGFLDSQENSSLVVFNWVSEITRLFPSKEKNEV
jgi:hypothetical protein